MRLPADADSLPENPLRACTKPQGPLACNERHSSENYLSEERKRGKEFGKMVKRTLQEKRDGYQALLAIKSGSRSLSFRFALRRFRASVCVYFVVPDKIRIVPPALDAPIADPINLNGDANDPFPFVDALKFT